MAAPLTPAQYAQLQKIGASLPGAAPPPPVVEDLGGDLTPNTPEKAAHAAAAAQMMGYAPAPAPAGMGPSHAGPAIPIAPPAPDPMLMIAPKVDAPVAPPPVAPPAAPVSWEAAKKQGVAAFVAAPPASVEAPPTDWSSKPKYTQSDENLLASLQKEAAAAKAAGKDTSALEERIHNLMLHRENAPSAGGIQPKVGVGPAPSSGAGGGAKPHPLTFDDKKNSVLLPGEETLFQDVKEAKQMDEIWESAKLDKRMEGEQQAALEYEKGVAEQETLLKKQQEADAKFQAWAEADHAKRAALADDIAKTKIDAGNFWASRSTGQHILIGISMAFGVMGANAQNGGENKAVSTIDNAIKQDLQIQMANLEAKKGALAVKQNEYGMRRAMFQDERAARASFMSDSYKLVAKRMEHIAMTTQNEEKKIEAIRLRDMYDNKAKIEDDQFALSIEQKYAIKKEAEARAAAAAAGAMAKKKADLEEWKFKTWFADRSKADADVYKEGGGTGGTNVVVGWDAANNKPVMGSVPMASKDDAKDAKEASIAYASLKTNLAEYKALIRKYEGVGGGAKAVGSAAAPWTTDMDADKARAETLQTMMLGDINKINKFGAMDNGTQALLTKQIGENPLGFGSKAKIAKIEVIEGKADADYANKFNTHKKGPPVNAPETEVGFKPIK